MPKNNIGLITDYYATNLVELRLYADKILNDTEEAKDVVQECFMRLIDMENQIIPLTMPSMIHNMVRNMSVSVIRRKAILREYKRMKSASTVCMTEHLETRIVATDLVSKISKRIESLPGDCRTIYEMNLYEGMKVGEIASRLNIGYKYAEKKLGKARSEVRKALRNVG